jgi:hypothetical protein
MSYNPNDERRAERETVREQRITALLADGCGLHHNERMKVWDARRAVEAAEESTKFARERLFKAENELLHVAEIADLREDILKRMEKAKSTRIAIRRKRP